MFILIFRALIVRKGRGGGKQKKRNSNLEFTAIAKCRKLHVFNLMTTCSVIVASTLTAHQNDSKWCWHKITRHGTKHLMHTEGKPWKECNNDSSLS